nr:unnamed protein product [Callosobruchus chinensis]
MLEGLLNMETISMIAINTFLIFSYEKAGWFRKSHFKPEISEQVYKNCSFQNGGSKAWKMQMCFANEITLVLEFLTHHFKLGASYGTLNSYRSALDQILDPQIAQDYRIKRFFKGIYNLRSNCPNTPIHGTQNWSLIS